MQLLFNEAANTALGTIDPAWIDVGGTIPTPTVVTNGDGNARCSDGSGAIDVWRVDAAYGTYQSSEVVTNPSATPSLAGWSATINNGAAGSGVRYRFAVLPDNTWSLFRNETVVIYNQPHAKDFAAAAVKIRIEHVPGGIINCYLDDVLAGSWTDSSELTNGGPGFVFSFRTVRTDTMIQSWADTATSGSAAPTLTDVDTDESIADGQSGVSVVGTGLVAGTTITLEDNGVVVDQLAVRNSDTSMTIPQVLLGGCRYGTRTLKATNVNGIATISVAVNPPANKKFTNLTSINATAANRLTGFPVDLDGTEQIEVSGVVGANLIDITVFTDASHAGPLGAQYFARANRGDGTGWGAPALQTFGSQQLAQPNPSASNIAQSTATLSWPAVANATSYVVDGVPNAPITVISPSINLTGLTPNTAYNPTVVAKANGYLDSAPGSTSFTTTQAQLATPAPSVSAITSNSASVTWPAVPNATSYQINGLPGGTITLSGTSQPLTGLSASTSYSLTVTAFASGFTNSNPGAVAFTTLPAAQPPGADPTPPTPPPTPTPTPFKYSELEELAKRMLTLYGDGAASVNFADLHTHVIEFANWIIDEINTHPYWEGRDPIPYYTSVNERRDIPDVIVVHGLLAYYAGQQQSDAKQARFQPQYYRTLSQQLYVMRYGNAPIELQTTH